MTKFTSSIIRFTVFALIMGLFLPFAASSAKAYPLFPTTTKVLPWHNPTPWGSTIGFDVNVNKGNVNIPLTGKLCVFLFVKNVLPVPTCAKPDNGGWAGIHIANNLPRGQYMVKAEYTGDGFFYQSESNITLTVGPNIPVVAIDDGSCPTTISKSKQPALWVTVTPNHGWMDQPNIHPTGQIVLYEGNKYVAASNLQPSDVQRAHGIASFNLNTYPGSGLLTLTVGVHNLTATYVSNDDNYWSGQSAPCTVTVTP